MVPLSPVPVVSIVDDDESVRSAMSSLVRSLGYRVAVFASAEAFLASPCLHETRFLILDVQMPGMSGLDLQDELRSRKHSVPTIFITAEAGGAMGFFGKPVDDEIVIRCLEEALRQSLNRT